MGEQTSGSTTAVMASLLSRAALATEKLALTKVSKVLSPACVSICQQRDLSVHQHVSMSLLKEAGVPVPNFGVAKSSDEAKKIAQDIATNDLVVKAQVLAGGRGKGSFKGGYKGGVKLVYSPEEVEDSAKGMIGDFLITKQTGADGRICNSVMITERKYTRKEYYIAFMNERAYNGPVIIASSEGGVNIEETAEKNPDSIVKFPIDVVQGLTVEGSKDVAVKLGIHESKVDDVAQILQNLYKLFISKDASMVEINPFAEDNSGNFVCLDAKLKFDDNAEFRQKAVFDQRDWSQEDAREVAAAEYNLNYIALDGDIGCMVNGAGLAMATMDIIKLHGGSPANFLDVGGGATANQVKEAFKIITGDPKVNALLVNIFGGIMRCDVIAEGIIAAAGELNLATPIVVRLQGTNVDEAKVMIGSSGLKILPVDNLDEAARLSCKLSKIVNLSRSAGLGVKFEMPI